METEIKIMQIFLEKICDFETASVCDWEFTNSRQLLEIEKQDILRAKKQFSINVTYTSSIQAVEHRIPQSHGAGHDDNNFKKVVGMVGGMMSGRNTTPSKLVLGVGLFLKEWFLDHYAYYSSKKAADDNIAMIVSPYYQHSSPSVSGSFWLPSI